MTATIAAIVDRFVELVTAITPASLASDRFRHTTDEKAGDFRDECEKSTSGAFRRFQVSDDGIDDGVPEVSSLDTEIREQTIVITVAYPHTHRYGAKNRRDRRRVMDEDYRKIYLEVGPGQGQSNFSGSHDCTLLNASMEIEEGEACDFLVVSVPVYFYLDVDGF